MPAMRVSRITPFGVKGEAKVLMTLAHKAGGYPQIQHGKILQQPIFLFTLQEIRPSQKTYLLLMVGNIIILHGIQQRVVVEQLIRDI